MPQETHAARRPQYAAAVISSRSTPTASAQRGIRGEIPTVRAVRRRPRRADQRTRQPTRRPHPAWPGASPSASARLHAAQATAARP